MFEDEAHAVSLGHAAAGVPSLVEDLDLQAMLDQAFGAGHTGGAGADDGDVWYLSWHDHDSRISYGVAAGSAMKLDILRARNKTGAVGNI